MCTVQHRRGHPLITNERAAAPRPVRSWDPAAALIRPSEWMPVLWRTLLLWQERASGRRHLMGLEERELADIGIARLDAEREINKPFWRS